MLALQIVILGFCLPYLIILMSRWLFAFYWPINWGMSLAQMEQRQPDRPSEDALQIFVITNTLIFFICFLALTVILYLPVIQRLFQISLPISYYWQIIYFFLVFYICWLLSLVGCGFLFGYDLLTGIDYDKFKCRFYFVELDVTYRLNRDLFRNFINHLGMILDSEKKIKERISIHRKLTEDFIKDDQKDAVDIMKNVIKMNEKRLSEIKKLHKKGFIYLLYNNFMNEIGALLIAPFIPAMTLYTFSFSVLANLFPSLREEPKES